MEICLHVLSRNIYSILCLSLSFYPMTLSFQSKAFKSWTSFIGLSDNKQNGFNTFKYKEI